MKIFQGDDENSGSFLLVALVVKIWWQRCWEEELKVADCSLHCDIKRTKEGSPLIQHLLGGRLWKVPVWTPTEHNAQVWQCHWGQKDNNGKLIVTVENVHSEVNLNHRLSLPGQFGEGEWEGGGCVTMCVFCKLCRSFEASTALFGIPNPLVDLEKLSLPAKNTLLRAEPQWSLGSWLRITVPSRRNGELSHKTDLDEIIGLSARVQIDGQDATLA